MNRFEVKIRVLKSQCNKTTKRNYRKDWMKIPLLFNPFAASSATMSCFQNGCPPWLLQIQIAPERRSNRWFVGFITTRALPTFVYIYTSITETSSHRVSYFRVLPLNLTKKWLNNKKRNLPVQPISLIKSASARKSSIRWGKFGALQWKQISPVDVYMNLFALSRFQSIPFVSL